MRNLGLVVETDFKAAGIHTAAEVIALGAEKAFLKMLDGRKKLGRSGKCCNALYLYAIYGAIHNCDWRDIPASKKEKFKAYTSMRRKSGRYGA